MNIETAVTVDVIGRDLPYRDVRTSRGIARQRAIADGRVEAPY
jgi:hypothetical protein